MFCYTNERDVIFLLKYLLMSYYSFWFVFHFRAKTFSFLALKQFDKTWKSLWALGIVSIVRIWAFKRIKKVAWMVNTYTLDSAPSTPQSSLKAFSSLFITRLLCLISRLGHTPFTHTSHTDTPLFQMLPALPGFHSILNLWIPCHRLLPPLRALGYCLNVPCPQETAALD